MWHTINYHVISVDNLYYSSLSKFLLYIHKIIQQLSSKEIYTRFRDGPRILFQQEQIYISFKNKYNKE